jgi:hypothetical protein
MKNITNNNSHKNLPFWQILVLTFMWTLPLWALAAALVCEQFGL